MKDVGLALTKPDAAPADTKASLAEKAEVLRTQLGLDKGASVKDTIDQAAVQLGLSGLEHVPLVAKADASLQSLGITADYKAQAPAAAEERPAAEGPSIIDGIFKFFAKADTDNSRSIDPQELSRSLSLNATFKKSLCDVAGVKNPEAMSDDQIAVLRVADADGDGALQIAELEALLRGWKPDEHKTRGDMTKANEQRRLAGARERAERARVEGGGFAGLTDADEAKRIGEASQTITAAEKFAFNESDPTVFHDGAVYATDAEAKAARDEKEKEIRKQEMDEYLYKEQFKGLTDAEEALRVGESVKLGGEILEIEGSEPKKKMPAALAAKMKKKE